MPRIYLSYAQENEDFARELTAELVRAGVEVESASTLHSEDPRRSDERIEAALRRSDALIVLFSHAARESAWIQQELDFAQMLRNGGLGGVIIPVILEPVRLPESLADAHTINAMGRSPEEVAQAIRGLLATDATDAGEERARGITFPAPDNDEPMSQAYPPPDVAAAPSWDSGTMWPSPPPAPASGAPPIPDEPLASAPATGALASPPVPSRAKAAKEAETQTLQFSAYHANTLAVETWNTLLVYAAVDAALDAVAADASTFSELGSAPRTSSGQASRALAQGAELTIEPHMEGVTFSPPSETFIWRGGWHRSLFRFQAAAALASKEQAGWVDIYSGPMVPVARVDLAFSFTASRPALAIHQRAGRTVTSNPHDTVFISYSHHDHEAFSQACDEYTRFGIQVYTDEHLDAGADYERELGRMIAGARVFHLLWSPTSANSVECRKEWTAALLREPSERFIKPWFWRQPLTAPPSEFVEHHISFRFQRLRRRLFKPETWF